MTAARWPARAWVAAAALGLATGAAAYDPDAVAKDLRLGRYEAVESAAAARVAEAPGDADAWHALGDARAARGRAGPALLAYARALAAGSRRPLAVTVAAARVRALAGEPDPAFVAWRGVLERWRAGGITDPGELLAVADAARALGRTDPSLRRTALRLYEEVMRRAPADPAPRAALAALLLRSYNNAEALPLYQEALELDPQHPASLLGLARSLAFDSSGGALDAARAAVEAAPGVVAARVFLARQLMEHEDPQGAQAALEAARAVNPHSLEVLGALAALRDHAGDDDGVSALLRRIEAIAPGHAGAYETLAEEASDRRRYADAVRYGMRAVAMDPTSWRGHALLGMNRLRLGQVEAARRDLETAFRGDPFNVWVKNTLDLMDGMAGYESLFQGRFLFTGTPRHVAVLAPHLLSVAEAAYAAHERRYGVSPPVPVRIEMHPEHDDLSVRTLGVVGVDLLGVSFGPTVVVDAPLANPGEPFNWGAVLWHELAHTFQLSMSQGRAPRWIAEGMAVLDERLGRPGWGADAGPGFLQAYARGELARASELNASFLRPDSGEALGYAYIQAGLLAEHIEEEHELRALREFLNGYKRGRSTHALIREVLRMEPAQLDASFDAFMQRRFGGALEALADEPNASGKGPPGNRYARLLRRGMKALDEGDLDAAELALLEARGLIPGHTGAHGPHHGLERLYRERGDRAAAAAVLEERVAVDADDLEALLRLAEDLEALEDAPGAAHALERSLLIQPMDAAVRQRLAVLYEEQAEWRLAMREWAAVVALGAVDPIQARYQLALAASHAGEAERARREILRALEAAPLFQEGLELLLAIREQLAGPRPSSSNEPAKDPRP